MVWMLLCLFIVLATMNILFACGQQLILIAQNSDCFQFSNPMDDVKRHLTMNKSPY